MGHKEVVAFTGEGQSQAMQQMESDMAELDAREQAIRQIIRKKSLSHVDATKAKSKNTYTPSKKSKKKENISTFEAMDKLPEGFSAYKKKIKVVASAYSAFDPGNGNMTANGNILRKGYIAVDPTVIPLGTEVFVEGYGFAVADDTGGDIIGNRIDVAMDTHEEALNYGRQETILYILK